MDYLSNQSLVVYRLKRFSFACIQAIHHYRNQLKDQLLINGEESSASATILLQALVLLLDPKLPWACKTVGYLMQRNVFSLFREVILTAKENMDGKGSSVKVSALEHVLACMISHVGQSPCICSNVDPQWSFSFQILTILFLWQTFPYLKEVFVSRSLIQYYTNQMALCVQNHANVFSTDILNEFPGYACILGNILETTSAALSQPDCSFEMDVFNLLPNLNINELIKAFAGHLTAMSDVYSFGVVLLDLLTRRGSLDNRQSPRE